MMFGGITVVCGILGTLAGGFVLDYMTNTLSNAFKVGIWIQSANLAFLYTCLCIADSRFFCYLLSTLKINIS